MTDRSNWERGKVLTRLRVIGVPSEVSKPFVREVEKWIECSGLEWTVTRLKSICVDLIRRRAGMRPVSQWVKFSPAKDRWFSGAVGALEAWGFKGNNFPRMVQALRIYTNYYAGGVTPAQAKKFLSGVVSYPIPIPSDVLDSLDWGLLLSGLQPGKLQEAKPLLTRVPTDKRAPTPWGSFPEVEATVDSVLYLVSDNQRHYFRYSNLYEPVLRGLEPELLIADMTDIQTDVAVEEFSSVSRSAGETLWVGSIGIIQEPGFKLRAIANPGRVFQQVLKPLGDYLFEVLRDLPWDCTFDQSKADVAICNALTEGKKVFSVDLTGATDYFPLALQERVLRALLPFSGDTISMFCEIAHGLWKINPQIIRDSGIQVYEPEGFIRWYKGQPLGLYPSFASFALTHGLLLLGLLNRPWKGEFYVLGDDVVILDTELYAKYRVVLTSLECPVSDGKTFASEKVAEFRSRIYEPGNFYPQLKWRHVSDENFLDILKLLGMKGMDLLDRRQRDVARIVAGLHESVGGLGLNPNGWSLDKRMGPFLALFLEDYRAVERLTDYSVICRKLLFSSRLISESWASMSPVMQRDLTWLATDFDQKSYHVAVSTLGPIVGSWWKILGMNLDLVFEGNLDLPSNGIPSRRTTLQKWETLLTSVLGNRWRDQLLRK